MTSVWTVVIFFNTVNWHLQLCSWRILIVEDTSLAVMRNLDRSGYRNGLFLHLCGIPEFFFSFKNIYMLIYVCLVVHWFFPRKSMENLLVCCKILLISYLSWMSLSLKKKPMTLKCHNWLYCVSFNCN